MLWDLIGSMTHMEFSYKQKAEYQVEATDSLVELEVLAQIHTQTFSNLSI